MEEKTLFLRKATGLIRAWSVYDAFVYAALSVNIVSLGMYIFSFAPFWPDGNLIPAILIAFLLMFSVIIAYCGMISVMPRAGGDYVWLSRVFGGAWGCLLAIPCWVTCLWLWAPIYGQMLAWECVAPVLLVIGYYNRDPGIINAAMWWFAAKEAYFVGTIIVCIFVFFYIAMGMKNYAILQKWLFHIGMAGIVSFFVILAAYGREAFIASFNNFASQVFGYMGDAYADTIKNAVESGLTLYPFWNWWTPGTISLVPLVLFMSLYPMWGSTLYGEVRGAGDFKKQTLAMGGGSTLMNVLAMVMMALLAYTVGYEFFQAANWAYWYGVSPTGAMWPFPPIWAAILTHPAIALWTLITIQMIFWAWSGTLFLSSTRVLFALSFDRVFPAWFGKVTTRFRTPINSLIFMFAMSLLIAYCYFYVEVFGVPFSTLTLDAVFMIATCYAAVCLAAAVVPYKRPDLYMRAPVAKYKIGKIPLITISGIIGFAFLLWVMYMWAVDSTYGVNSPLSALYLLANYIGALMVYYISKWYRRRQGIELDFLYKEIPVE